MIRWQPIFAALRQAGTRFLFIEQEDVPVANAIDILSRNYRSLAGL